MRADVEGGALMDVGCYCVSGSRLLGGEPQRAYAEQVVGATGVDVVFAGTLAFADEVTAQFVCGLELPDRDELEVIGSEGALFLDDPWHCRVPVIEVPPGRRRGADQGRARRLLPARAREHGRCDPRQREAAPRPRRRRCERPRDRGALPLRRGGQIVRL